MALASQKFFETPSNQGSNSKTINHSDEMHDNLVYYKSFEDLLLSGYSVNVENNNVNHAVMQISAFFNHAKKSVRIFCNQLSKSVYSEPFLLESLFSALIRGITVQIITQNKTIQATDFKQILLANNGELYNTNSDEIINADMNFALMDKTALRYEHCKDDCKATTLLRKKKAKEYSTLYNLMLHKCFKVS